MIHQTDFSIIELLIKRTKSFVHDADNTSLIIGFESLTVTVIFLVNQNISLAVFMIH